tara:strand:- start:932 stop:2029 length:1098 start_codon:yes stop_codon:yes gene_type:complete
MKQGLESVEQLVERAGVLASLKRDYVADVRKTCMYYAGNDEFGLALEDESNYKINDHALKQMGSWAHIPVSYINHMRNSGHHQLLVDNFNQWFEKPKHVNNFRRLYRGMAGEFSEHSGVWRSFHSDKFQRVDHEHILEDILPALQELADEFGGIRVVSCEITDNKMYVKVIFPELEAEVVGDVVRMGLSIGNSETGMSNVYILPLLDVLRCLNGMVLPHRGVKRRHIGSTIQSDGQVTYADDTIEANLKAIKLQVRDSMTDVMNSFKDGSLIEEVKKSGESTKVREPAKAIEATAKLFSLTDKETDTAKLSWGKLLDYSKWGMMNCITEVANTHESYDRASELEIIGGKIISMPNHQWDRIALAA